MRFNEIFKKIKQDDTSKYRIIELEAENDKLKDELIASLSSEVENLKALLLHTTNQSRSEPLTPDTGLAFPKVRPVLRTSSEMINRLEELSAKRKQDAKNLDSAS